ncbi:hypothetical protein FOXG_12510 [Fusarium oxysporum f. sp. lycopersici 4287]|uniref:C2H2-type domain-containing protein n=2 Tax=Fusarium oxysporum TaxID=5507 RepID=A0A0J9VSN3_FUSO4|nr:hypothetical protein FOXG_12510 [Fusarium oxysporum f. sp. lycopersici 4287]XP_018251909.1 hypothetical protein FOXG_12510 [Fusarium oxysporum f. sp. lycopersici 4287]EWZ79277.1 hypothetical protein FOWG_16561 [Fusarium oxysporum f. sp. lycopersici MN25]EWZ79278.1 hypothetical protein FOWG_16561 [Fusarium oxysporum f. sp. lycopersici MN25]KNB13863.1 hypothetical protein FOXG_12510 [Fusarium oxysporum f. sp. lycopersici 4287]KNB13864.1 hypothetical protein FOXG_12510 [Fusarium oxysporum f. s
MTQPDRCNHQTHPVKSDNNAPTDPPIAAPNTTYASYGQNSTHAPSPEMRHSYSYPGGGMYALPRPDWPGYVRNGGAPLTLGPPAYAPNPASTSSQTRPSNGYSFVQVPSVPEKKRTRRRPDQIDRIYKCGWNGCDKAYGTLNHLNAHVTMQSHGQKRVPGEFKKIREEWKQRKKEEAANRKHQGERQHQAATAAAAQNGGCESWEPCVPSYAGLNVPLCPRRYQLGPQQHFIAQKSTYDPHQHSQSCEQPSQFPSSPYDIQRLGVAS